MKREYVIDLLTSLIGDKPTAELVFERLNEEGLLHLGYGNKDIDAIVTTFMETFGTTKTTRQDRWAANRLVSKYGAQSVIGIIKLLAEKSSDKYAPVVGNVAQLETKWVNVLNFLRSSGDEIIE